IKSAVLTELLQYAARYRKENPVAATELLVNKTVIVEAIDMGEVQLPVSKEESVPEMEPDKPENDLELNGLNFDVDFSQFEENRLIMMLFYYCFSVAKAF